MIFIGGDIFKSKKEKFFLIASACTIFMGILVSGARGVWVALLPACFITLYHYSRKSAFIFLSSLVLVLTIALSCSNDLVKRTTSIITSFYTENEAGSTGNRLELWKGSYLMFRQSPLMGVGSGDFEAVIKRYIAEKKLHDIPATGHAHNIYFQSLATRGLVGFGILVALFTAIILWGRNEIKAHNEVGGYIIIISTLLAVMGGLTENNIEIHRYLAAYGFTIGLIGPYGTSNDNNPHITKWK
jgi:O-antigen ligase